MKDTSAKNFNLNLNLDIKIIRTRYQYQYQYYRTHNSISISIHSGFKDFLITSPPQRMPLVANYY